MYVVQIRIQNSDVWVPVNVHDPDEAEGFAELASAWDAHGRFAAKQNGRAYRVVKEEVMEPPRVWEVGTLYCFKAQGPAWECVYVYPDGQAMLVTATGGAFKARADQINDMHTLDF